VRLIDVEDVDDDLDMGSRMGAVGALDVNLRSIRSLPKEFDPVADTRCCLMRWFCSPSTENADQTKKKQNTPGKTAERCGNHGHSVQGEVPSAHKWKYVMVEHLSGIEE